ncbi:MAG: haloacid dehalogenase-like hydrolase [Polyangiaceae bacterium]|nr:haloacid dehalogenase-like hydrolase [Polyangiaceae bacterium]
MRPTILLFDVDGTLIRTAGAGRRAIVRALEPHGAGIAAEFSFAGMTDRAIVRRALETARLEASEARIDAVLAGYLAVLREEVERAGATYGVHAGMVATLDAVRGRAGYAVGLGTGNIEAGAHIKLEKVGLRDRFAFGGFGSDAEDRAELLRVGAERGAARLRVAVERCRVVVIGDTPKDIAAGRAIGAECVAVATGSFTPEQLRPHAPDHVFATLADEGALETVLG